MQTVSFVFRLWAGLAFWEASVGSIAPLGARDGGKPSSRETQKLGKEEAERKISGKIKVLKGCCILQGIRSMTRMGRANMHSEKTWGDSRLVPLADLWAPNNRK